MSAIQRVVDGGDLADAGKATWRVLHCVDQSKGEGNAVTGTVETNLLDASANSTPSGTNRATGGMQLPHTWRTGERWFAEIETAPASSLAQVVQQQ